MNIINKNDIVVTHTYSCNHGTVKLTATNIDKIKSHEFIILNDTFWSNYSLMCIVCKIKAEIIYAYQYSKNNIITFSFLSDNNEVIKQILSCKEEIMRKSCE